MNPDECLVVFEVSWLRCREGGLCVVCKLLDGVGIGVENERFHLCRDVVAATSMCLCS